MSPEQLIYDRLYHVMRCAERIEDWTRGNTVRFWIQTVLLVAILVKVW